MGKVTQRAALCLGTVLAALAFAETPTLEAIALGSTAPKWPVVDATLEVADGVFTLSGKGHDFYWGWDRGAFAYTKIEGTGDYTFQARVLTPPDGCVSGKFGIGVREGLVGNEKAVSVRFDEHWSSATWFYRFQPGDAATEFCAGGERYTCFVEGQEASLTTAAGMWFKVQRAGFVYTLWAGDDGQNWVRLAEDQVTATGVSKIFLNPQSTYVGLIFSCGEKGYIPGSVQFDNVDLNGVPISAVAPAVSGVRAAGAPRAWLSGNAVHLALGKGLTAGDVRRVSIIDTRGRQVAALDARGQQVGSELVIPVTVSPAPGIYRAVITTSQGEVTTGAASLSVR